MKICQLTVCGIPFPPEEAIREVFSKFKNQESLIEFARISNESTVRIYKQFSPEECLNVCTDDNDRQVLELYMACRLIQWRKCCITDGCSTSIVKGINIQEYLKVCQEGDPASYIECIQKMKGLNSVVPKFYSIVENATALLIWYIDVIGTPTAGNAQQGRKTATSIIRMLSGKKGFRPLKKIETIELPSFNDYPLYNLAKSLFIDQRIAEGKAAVEDKEMQALFVLEHEVTLALNSPLENIDKGEYRSFCQYCKDYFYTSQKKPPTCCENCKTARNTASRQKSRSSDIHKEITRRKKTSGGKRRACRLCGEKRLVYEGCCCKECLGETCSG
jgi:hypothetical protein